MKRILVAVILYAFSFNAFAENEIKVLSELQKQMVNQSSKIFLEYDKQKISNNNELYQNIWIEENFVIDCTEVAVNTVELFNSINDKNGPTKFRVWRNLVLMEANCRRSLVNLNGYRDDIKIPSIKNEVAKQAAYANQACDDIKVLIAQHAL